MSPWEWWTVQGVVAMFKHFVLVPFLRTRGSPLLCDTGWQSMGEGAGLAERDGGLQESVCGCHAPLPSFTCGAFLGA